MDRRSAQTLKPSELSLQDVATLLHYAYGVNRQYVNKALQRSLRHVPSAGALYPLEIFFQSNRVKSLEPGLYHYHPIRHHMRLLQPALSPTRISEALIQPDIASGASLIIFITGLFERSIFKYGDRGYRYCLIEAGHVAQNLDLVSTALGLGFMNVGGFFDRRVDEFLGLDGVTHSVLYLVAIGEHSAR
jgi:SagB-type dehydrogenase family enzyme